MTHYQYSFTVGAAAIDENGHVNNVEYVRWMQQAATRHAASYGLMDLLAADRATWVVREHDIKYLRPAFEGETIIVQTWVADFRRVRSSRRYRFIREGDRALLAEGATEWIYVDIDSQKPKKPAANIIDLFERIKSSGPPETNR